MSEVGRRRSEVGGWRMEDGGWRSELNTRIIETTLPYRQAGNFEDNNKPERLKFE